MIFFSFIFIPFLLIGPIMLFVFFFFCFFCFYSISVDRAHNSAALGSSLMSINPQNDVIPDHVMTM